MYKLETPVPEPRGCWQACVLVKCCAELQMDLRYVDNAQSTGCMSHLGTRQRLEIISGVTGVVP